MISIFSRMRHSTMRSVSKRDNARRTLLFVAIAIVASGLLIGCPEPAPANNGGGAAPDAPNLTITAFTITNGATSAAAGSMINAQVTVRNSGNADSPATTVSFALVNSAGVVQKELTGTITVPAIKKGRSATVLGAVAIPSNTTAITGYLVRAMVVAVKGETGAAASNNTFILGGGTPVTFTITAATAPDLEITQFIVTSGATSAATGGVFEASVTVRNVGNVESEPAAVSVMLLDNRNAATALTGTIMVDAVPAGMSTTALTGMITVPVGTTNGTYRLRAVVAAVPGESNTNNNGRFLGGTSRTANFTITALGDTTFNLASGCVVFIGSPMNCGEARTADLAAGAAIGTVASTGATAFAIIGNNNDFAISSSGAVTTKRAGALDTFNLPAMFDIMVTGGVGAGTQRVHIINDANTRANNMDVTAQLSAPAATGATLFTPGTSTGRIFACSDQPAGCVTSLQTAVLTGNGWFSNYNSGTTGTAFNTTGYSRVYIEYNLDTNTISGGALVEFTLRLADAYYDLLAVDGLIANGMWQTVSIPLTKSPTRGSLDRRYLTGIGFYDQETGYSLSVRAVYLR